MDSKFDALMKVLIAKKIVDDPMSALGMLGAGAAQASGIGQARRPYVMVEVDSDGESVLVNAAKAVEKGAKDEKALPLNVTPIKAVVRK